MVWIPIVRTKVQLAGTEGEIVNLNILLSERVPEEWKRRFENPIAVEQPESMRRAIVSSGSIQFTVVEENLRPHMAIIDQRIAEANDYYLGEVLPALEAADERRAAETQARQDRLQRLQAVIADL